MNPPLRMKDDPRDHVGDPMQSGWQRNVPLAAVVLSFAVVATYFLDLPNTIPTKKGNYQISKYILWLLPAINLGLYYLMSLTTKTSYATFNYPFGIRPDNAAVQHQIALDTIAAVRTGACLMLAYASYSWVKSVASGREVFSELAMGAMSMLLLATIGFYIWRAYTHR